MKRLSVLALMIVLASPLEPHALDKNKAAYIGGTITRFTAAKDRIEGRLDISAAHHLIFIADDGTHAGQPLLIDYATIQDLEFGQRAGRRVATAAGATVLLGPIGLLSLSLKKREHYLTVAFADEHGRNQVAVLELGKDTVRVTLATIEARAGKAIEYQDEEARKWSR
jgi:hypothetical protein